MMDKKIWQNPKAAHQLDEAETPLWFWNDKLEKEELERQLKMQTEIGVTSTNPHARTNNGDGYIGGYLDQEWFDHIKTVLNYKAAHDEKMWLYDEIDWPAGTCNQTITLDENYREQYVEIQTVEIPAGTPYRVQCLTFEGQGLFGLQPETDKSAMAFNVNIVDKETGEKYDIEQFFTYLMFGPELEFVSERDSIAYVTKLRVDPYKAGGNEQVNYMDADATRAFLKSTYDKYAEEVGDEMGKAITTVFNDETRMCNAIPWSKDFAEAFRKAKGYDIRKELYRIILPGTDNGRIRCDYFDMVADQYQKNYFGEIHKWCEAHDLKLFAHLLGEETLFGHVRYSGDYLRQNRYQDVVGADHLGKGIGSLNIKFTACGAHSYGKKQTAVEVFAGCGWDMTFDEYTRIVTWMYQMGMHTIINHGFFYSDRGNRKNDWPPSQFFQWQGWDRMSEGNDMIRRLNYTLTDGINEADILVYHPIETMWLHYLPDQGYTHGFFRGAFLAGEEAVKLDHDMQIFLNGLLSRNLDFDLVHKDAIENFAVADGQKIRNIASGQEFSVLVLPMMEVIPLEMAELVMAYANAGGKIICVDKVPMLGMNPAEDAKVAAIMQKLLDQDLIELRPFGKEEELYTAVSECIPHPVQIVAGTAGTVNNHPAYPAYLIDPYMHGGEDLDGVLFNRYIGADGKRRTVFMNYGSQPDTIQVYVERIDAEASPIRIWDTMSGAITDAKVVETRDSGVVIEVELPCNHGVVVA